MAVGQITLNVVTNAATAIPQGVVQGQASAQKYLNARPLQLRVNTAGLNNLNLSKSLPLGKISGEAKDFEKSMSAATSRVLAFGATVGTIYAVQAAFRDIVSTTIEVEKALTNIKVISNATGTEFTKLSNGIFNAALKTSESFKNAADVALEFSRQGLSVEETLKRTNSALILTKTAGVSTQQAVESLTAVMNTFGKEVSSTADIVDRITSVDNAFAVSSKDLEDGLSRVGNAAQEAGVSLNVTLGAITALQQRTARGGAIIGNALKSIFTRVGRPENVELLNQLGVSTETVSGKSRDAISVLKDLAGVYKGLGDSQRKQVSEQIAGLYQINQFQALLSDLGSQWSIVDQASQKASNSMGSANARMLEINKTTDALISQTMTNFTKLASTIGNMTFQNPLKDMLSNVGADGSMLSAILASFDTLGTKTPDVGAKIAEGVFKGIGNFISGPGLIMVYKLLTPIIGNIGKFTAQAFSSLSGSNTQLKEMQQLQVGINNMLATGNAYYADRFRKATSVLQAEEALLGLMRTQNSLAPVAPKTAGLFQRGFTVDPNSMSSAPKFTQSIAGRGKRVFGLSGGHNPLEKEFSDIATRPDYAGHRNAQPIKKKVKINGRTEDVWINSAEKVIPNYGNTGDHAILNPRQQRMGFASGRVPHSPYSGGGHYGVGESILRSPMYRQALKSSSGAKEFFNSIKDRKDLSPFEVLDLFSKHITSHNATTGKSYIRAENPGGYKSFSPFGFRGLRSTSDKRIDRLLHTDELNSILSGKKISSTGSNNGSYGGLDRIHFGSKISTASSYGQLGYIINPHSVANRGGRFATADTNTAYNFTTRDIGLSDLLGIFSLPQAIAKKQNVKGNFKLFDPSSEGLDGAIKHIGDFRDKLGIYSSGYIPNFAGLSNPFSAGIRSTLKQARSGNFEMVRTDPRINNQYVSGYYDPNTDIVKAGRRSGMNMEVLPHEFMHMAANRSGIEKIFSDLNFTGRMRNAPSQYTAKRMAMDPDVYPSPRKSYLSESFADLPNMPSKEAINVLKMYGLTDKQVGRAMSLVERMRKNSSIGLIKKVMGGMNKSSGYIPNFARDILSSSRLKGATKWEKRIAALFNFDIVDQRDIQRDRETPYGFPGTIDLRLLKRQKLSGRVIDTGADFAGENSYRRRFTGAQVTSIRPMPSDINKYEETKLSPYFEKSVRVSDMLSKDKDRVKGETYRERIHRVATKEFGDDFWVKVIEGDNALQSKGVSHSSRFLSKDDKLDNATNLMVQKGIPGALGYFAKHGKMAPEYRVDMMRSKMFGAIPLGFPSFKGHTPGGGVNSLHSYFDDYSLSRPLLSLRNTVLGSGVFGKYGQKYRDHQKSMDRENKYKRSIFSSFGNPINAVRAVYTAWKTVSGIPWEKSGKSAFGVDVTLGRPLETNPITTQQTPVYQFLNQLVAGIVTRRQSNSDIRKFTKEGKAIGEIQNRKEQEKAFREYQSKLSEFSSYDEYGYNKVAKNLTKFGFGVGFGKSGPVVRGESAIKAFARRGMAGGHNPLADAIAREAQQVNGSQIRVQDFNTHKGSFTGVTNTRDEPNRTSALVAAGTRGKNAGVPNFAVNTDRLRETLADVLARFPLKRRFNPIGKPNPTVLIPKPNPTTFIPRPIGTNMLPPSDISSAQIYGGLMGGQLATPVVDNRFGKGRQRTVIGPERQGILANSRDRMGQATRDSSINRKNFLEQERISRMDRGVQFSLERGMNLNSLQKKHLYDTPIRDRVKSHYGLDEAGTTRKIEELRAKQTEMNKNGGKLIVTNPTEEKLIRDLLKYSASDTKNLGMMARNVTQTQGNVHLAGAMLDDKVSKIGGFKAMFGNAEKIVNKSISSNGLGILNSNTEEAMAYKSQALEKLKQRRHGLRQQASMGMAFGLPMAAGMVQEMAGPDSIGGMIASKSLNYGGMGAALAGPWGGVAGLAIGGIAGAMEAPKMTSDNKAKEIARQKGERVNNIGQFDQYTAAKAQLDDLVQSGASEKSIKEAQRMATEARSKITDSKLLAASNLSPEDSAKVRDEYATETNKREYRQGLKLREKDLNNVWNGPASTKEYERLAGQVIKENGLTGLDKIQAGAGNSDRLFNGYTSIGSTGLGGKSVAGVKNYLTDEEETAAANHLKDLGVVTADNVEAFDKLKKELDAGLEFASPEEANKAMDSFRFALEDMTKGVKNKDVVNKTFRYAGSEDRRSIANRFSTVSDDIKEKQKVEEARKKIVQAKDISYAFSKDQISSDLTQFKFGNQKRDSIQIDRMAIESAKLSQEANSPYTSESGKIKNDLINSIKEQGLGLKESELSFNENRTNNVKQGAGQAMDLITQISSRSLDSDLFSKYMTQMGSSTTSKDFSENLNNLLSQTSIKAGDMEGKKIVEQLHLLNANVRSGDEKLVVTQNSTRDAFTRNVEYTKSVADNQRKMLDLQRSLGSMGGLRGFGKESSMLNIGGVANHVQKYKDQRDVERSNNSGFGTLTKLGRQTQRSRYATSLVNGNMEVADMMKNTLGMSPEEIAKSGAVNYGEIAKGKAESSKMALLDKSRSTATDFINSSKLDNPVQLEQIRKAQTPEEIKKILSGVTSRNNPSAMKIKPQIMAQLDAYSKKYGKTDAESKDMVAADFKLKSTGEIDKLTKQSGEYKAWGGEAYIKQLATAGNALYQDKGMSGLTSGEKDKSTWYLDEIKRVQEAKKTSEAASKELENPMAAEPIDANTAQLKALTEALAVYEGAKKETTTPVANSANITINATSAPTPEISELGERLEILLKRLGWVLPPKVKSPTE